MNARLFRTALLAAAGLAMSASLVVAEPPADAPAKPADAAKQPAETAKPAAKADGTLKIGDKAPALTVAKFVKGTPVTSFEKGQIYVVEFWATWCGPCKVSIPHLTEMAKKYKDRGVKVVGVSVWEGDQAEVEPFVKEMGDKMDYIVAMDEVPKLSADISAGTPEAGAFYRENGKMSKEWMLASKSGGIPTAFIVNKDGNIAWIGHPMGMDGVLEKVVAGTFDSAKFVEQQAKMDLIKKEINKAVGNKDWDKAIKSMDEIIALDPSLAGQVGAAKFRMLLTGKKDYTAAYKQANELADGPIKDDAQTLNQIAWTILDGKGIQTRDFDTAMKLAARAAEVTKNQDGAILDTLARAYWEKGDKAKAVEIQSKAIAVTKEEDLKSQLESTLQRYQSESGKK